MLGLESVLTVTNLLALLGGTVLGIAFGAMPGLSTTMAIVVLLPFSYGMDAVTGLIMMAGAYVGGTYGGSISAILVNTPGTPAAIATVIDGHTMALKGKGQEALVESAVASFWGTAIGFVALLTIAPSLAKFSLKFSAQESVWLALFGLSIISSLASKSLIKGVIGGFLGLMIGCIGADPQLGIARYTFGSLSLYSGLQTVPKLIGFYSITQLIGMLVDEFKKAEKNPGKKEILKLNKYKLSLRDICYYPITYLWCGLLGTFIGIIPACGTSIAAFLGYNEAKRISKHPELFGTGHREGIAGPEAANNAVIGGSLIPMMTLGIPGNNVSLVLMGALMLHGMTPGNDLFTGKAHITYPFIMALFFAAIIMALVGLAFAPQFAKINSIPDHYLATGIIVLVVIGAFSCTNNYFDVYVMLACGVVGYFCKRMGIDMTSVVLGSTLGPMAEKGLVRSITLCNGLLPAIGSMFTRPICLILMILTFTTVSVPLIRRYKEKKAAKSA